MTNFICNLIIRFPYPIIAIPAYLIARIFDRTESTFAAEIRDCSRDNLDNFPY